MKGNGNLINFKSNTDMVQTSYQYDYKGLMRKYSSIQIIDPDFSSGGVVIPDPQTMHTTMGKLDGYKKDLSQNDFSANSSLG